MSNTLKIGYFTFNNDNLLSNYTALYSGLPLFKAMQKVFLLVVTEAVLFSLLLEQTQTEFLLNADLILGKRKREQGG